MSQFGESGGQILPSTHQSLRAIPRACRKARIVAGYLPAGDLSLSFLRSELPPQVSLALVNLTVHVFPCAVCVWNFVVFS